MWLMDIYLYGISLKLLCECECGTFVSFTPEIASSWADPDKLRSLPRRFDKPPHKTVPCEECCWSSCCWLGAVLVEVFFLVWPKPKKLQLKVIIIFFECRLYKNLPFLLRGLHSSSQEVFVIFRSDKSRITVFF